MINLDNLRKLKKEFDHAELVVDCGKDRWEENRLEHKRDVALLALLDEVDSILKNNIPFDVGDWIKAQEEFYANQKEEDREYSQRFPDES